MQSCIWQHLRASFFHAGFNLICCQGIEEAEHSMELYSVSHRQKDGQMNDQNCDLRLEHSAWNREHNRDCRVFFIRDGWGDAILFTEVKETDD